MRLRIFAFLILLIPPSLWAEDECSTIDFSKDLGPVWNQYHTSWCHIFTGNDMATRHYQKLGILRAGERMHPLGEAILPQVVQSQSVVESTGVTSSPFRNWMAWSGTWIQRLKACKESDLLKVKDQADALFNQDWKDASMIFSGKCADAKKLCLLLRRPIQIAQELCQKFAEVEQNYWVSIVRENCSLTTPSGGSFYWWDKQRYEEIMSGKPVTPAAKVEREFSKVIADALNSGELAAIGYDASFIRKKKIKGPDSHYSSIVGRHRDAKGNCQYVVRNSWGPKCKGYSENVKCKEGNLTIPAEKLLRRIHTVQRIFNPDEGVESPDGKGIWYPKKGLVPVKADAVGP